MIEYLILVPLGYLLGSLPIGLMIGRLSRGVDIRNFGSGNTGMTNVVRTVGVPAGIAVLALDMGKAVLAVVLARVFTDDSSGIEALAGLAALVGHVFPIFSGFRGGKGTATGWGGLFILSPIAGLVATVFGMPALALSRYVSLGSLVGTTSGALALVILAATGYVPAGYALYGAIGAPFVLIRHRENIMRLVRGQERKLGKSVTLTRSEAPVGSGE